MNVYFNSQFSYCPLVWMFYDRNINTKVNNLHFRSLRMVYQNNTSSVEDLSKDGSVTVHHRSIQSLVIEMFRVAKGLAPVIMQQIFLQNIRVLLLTMYLPTPTPNLFSIIMLILGQQDMV